MMQEWIILLGTSGPIGLAGLRAFLGWNDLAPPRIELCWSKLLLGRPCPGCGLTRSFLALAGGDLPGAAAFNPLGPPLFLGFVLIAALTAVVIFFPRLPIPRMGRALIVFSMLGALLLRTASFYLI
jgi:hypothetical protein